MKRFVCLVRAPWGADFRRWSIDRKDNNEYLGFCACSVDRPDRPQSTMGLGLRSARVGDHVLDLISPEQRPSQEVFKALGSKVEMDLCRASQMRPTSVISLSQQVLSPASSRRGPWGGHEGGGHHTMAQV